MNMKSSNVFVLLSYSELSVRCLCFEMNTWHLNNNEVRHKHMNNNTNNIFLLQIENGKLKMFKNVENYFHSMDFSMLSLISVQFSKIPNAKQTANGNRVYATICHMFADCSGVKLVRAQTNFFFCSKQNSSAAKDNVQNIQQMVFRVENLQSKWSKYDGKSNKYQWKYCKCFHSIGWLWFHWISFILFVCSDSFLAKCHYLKICFRSLTYNHHMSQDYASDVALEPIIWIVDNFSGFLGPVNNHTIAKFHSIRTNLACFVSVFCCCSCCFDIGCGCDCSSGWAAILLGKEPSSNYTARDIRLLVTYKCHIPLCDGCIHTAWPSSWCKCNYSALISKEMTKIRKFEVNWWIDWIHLIFHHHFEDAFHVLHQKLINTKWKR